MKPLKKTLILFELTTIYVVVHSQLNQQVPFFQEAIRLIQSANCNGSEGLNNVLTRSFDELSGTFQSMSKMMDKMGDKITDKSAMKVMKQQMNVVVAQMNNLQQEVNSLTETRRQLVNGMRIQNGQLAIMNDMIAANGMQIVNKTIPEQVRFSTCNK